MLELSRDDNVLLDKLQWETFEYFLKEVNPANGLIADKTRDDWPASIAATGLALAAYPIGVERGFMTRDAAVRITLTTLRFLRDSPQGTAPDATGYKGFYYHFLDMKTGRRVWRCELSTVDSAFLLAGALPPPPTSINDIQEEEADPNARRRVVPPRRLAMGAEWRDDGHARLQAEIGFLNYRWEGYDEALLLYVLGLGSPTYPLPEESYAAWTSTYVWKKIYDYEFVYAGPLFIHQLSHIWIDFRGIQDAYMRDKGIDYFENSRRATYVQQQYAIHNPSSLRATVRIAGGSRRAMGPGRPRCKSTASSGISSTTWRAASRTGPTMARSLPGRWSLRCPLLRRSCCRRFGTLTTRKAQQADSYGFKATFNPTYPVSRQPMGLGVALELWIESGPHRIHDRKPPHGFDLAADAAVSVHRRGPAPGRIQRWLAMTVSRLSTWAVSTATTSRRRSDACVSLSPAKNRK